MHVVPAFFGKARARALEEAFEWMTVPARELDGPINPGALCNVLHLIEEEKKAVPTRQRARARSYPGHHRGAKYH